MGQDGRFRLQQMFWLDANSAADQQLAELIEGLKEQKVYTDTIRRGIRLDHDLRQGRLDSLFALYPWTRELFQAGQVGMNRASGYMPPLPDLPTAVITTAQPDLTVMGEEFLDFIS